MASMKLLSQSPTTLPISTLPSLIPFSLTNQTLPSNPFQSNPTRFIPRQTSRSTAIGSFGLWVAFSLSFEQNHSPSYVKQVRGTVIPPHGAPKAASVAVFAEGAEAEERKAAVADIVGGKELIEEIANVGMTGTWTHMPCFFSLCWFMQVRGTVIPPHGAPKAASVAVFAEGAEAEERKAAGADIVGGKELIEEIASNGLRSLFDLSKAIRQVKQVRGTVILPHGAHKVKDQVAQFSTRSGGHRKRKNYKHQQQGYLSSCIVD